MNTSDATLTERRRIQRHKIRGHAIARVPTAISVQVREISPLGLLLDAPEPVDIGAVASLRMTLSGEPFTADVQVQRVTATQSRTRPGFEIGVKFIALTGEHRQLIERFVKR